MEQSPSSEADSWAVSQDIFRLLWNQQIRHCIHESATGAW
jgi:hypothetical protein